MTLLRPTVELVAVAWLKAAVDGVSGNVATTLPDLSSWYNDQFIEVMNVGGTPGVENPMRNSVVTVNCFAAKLGSTKPPWNKAATLAEAVLEATYGVRYRPDPAVWITTLPTGYDNALVESVKAVSEIKKLPSDASQYAVFSLDLQFNWVRASLVVTSQ